MRNRDWGAVAYLSQAIGQQSEVQINASSYYSGGSTNINDVYTTNVNMSTTGNPNGIYDMSGCGEEFVAGYTDMGINDGSSVYSADPKYKDVFKAPTIPGDVPNAIIENKNKKGMAVSETCNPSMLYMFGGYLGWNDDIVMLPTSAGMYITRGGDMSHTNGIAGLYFVYARSQVGAGYNDSRTVIVNLK